MAGSGWGGLCVRGGNKNPLPDNRGEGSLAVQNILVVVVPVTGGRRLGEVTCGPDRALARIRPLKPCGHVPVQMVDGVRVFGVGLRQFPGEDLRLLLEPTCPQGLDRSAVLWVDFVRSNALVQGDPVRHVRPRREVLLGWIVDKSRPHWRRNEVVLV